MTKAMTFSNSEAYARSEYQRAVWVVQKAERDKLDVVETLVSHMVSPTLIAELTGKEVDRGKKVRPISRSEKLRAWALENLGAEVDRFTVAEVLECSEATASKVIKDNQDYFVKVKRGVYTVRDGLAERQQAKK